MELKTGIYQIINTVTNDSYIGQSLNIPVRFRVHRNQLEKGTHKNPFLRKSYKKYGKDKFIFNIILYCEVNELTYYEQELINILEPEYNTDAKCISLPKGRKCSEETKKRMSESHIGKTPWNYGKKHSEEWKQKISQSLKGNTNKLGKIKNQDIKDK